MGRPRRMFINGETYHVYSQGSNKFPVFLDGFDYEDFLLRVARVVRKYDWSLYAYCLMPNHHHLLVKIREGGLSQGMQQLNGDFSRRTSRKYGRVAHLFRNRFGATWIESEEQLVHAARYVVMNPLEAGICGHPRQWMWSSYRATAGEERAPGWLAVGDVLSHFATFDPGDPRRGYRRFVEKALLAVSDTGGDARTLPAGLSAAATSRRSAASRRPSLPRL